MWRTCCVTGAMGAIFTLQGAVSAAVETSPASDGQPLESRAWIEGFLPLSQPTSPEWPFSFRYGGRSSVELLPVWERVVEEAAPEGDAWRRTATWQDPGAGLQVRLDAVTYRDFPAVEWLLSFANTGDADTEIIEDIRCCDFRWRPEDGESAFRLYRTNGAPANPTDFAASVAPLRVGEEVTFGAGASVLPRIDYHLDGRSSNTDLPFYKVDCGNKSIVVAVGWTGRWQTSITQQDDQALSVRAGLQKARFRLHPGETIRMPRMLVLHWTGDTQESNAQFRLLLNRHYIPRWHAADHLPVIFCNTCFTRGGGWLNETTAENQISLINAYGPLGIEALITDSGWYEDVKPGSWVPRTDHYPDGMAPVAAAAKAQGLVYGLWFDPELVVKGSRIEQEHPEWLLQSPVPDDPVALLNFGLPEVQEHVFRIVSGYMALPGFRVYRQDCNLGTPGACWDAAGAPDRVGISEIRHITGLYTYWERLRAAHPDILMEGCSGGGRRIDLETLRHFHMHQKTDYWFDYQADQASLWGLSQYIPNNCVVAHLRDLDDYSFHSTLPSSLCLGWIADAPDFDAGRAKELVDRYKEVRSLMAGAWYPLLHYPESGQDWLVSQYHRPDLQAGLVVACRRPQSPYASVDVALRGLEPDATYECTYSSDGRKEQQTGSALMETWELTISEPRRSVLIEYRKVQRPKPGDGRG